MSDYIDLAEKMFDQKLYPVVKDVIEQNRTMSSINVLDRRQGKTVATALSAALGAVKDGYSSVIITDLHAQVKHFLYLLTSFKYDDSGVGIKQTRGGNSILIEYSNGATITIASHSSWSTNATKYDHLFYDGFFADGIVVLEGVKTDAIHIMLNKI